MNETNKNTLRSIIIFLLWITLIGGGAWGLMRESFSVPTFMIGVSASILGFLLVAAFHGR